MPSNKIEDIEKRLGRWVLLDAPVSNCNVTMTYAGWFERADRLSRAYERLYHMRMSSLDRSAYWVGAGGAAKLMQTEMLFLDRDIKWVEVEAQKAFDREYP